MQSKRPKNAIHGWINLNKPLGITSADAVNKAKWLLKPTKIGHAGTLDPLATGVLPLALGEGTKCINLLMDAKKTYEFAVTFGERRSTDDAEGEVVATSAKIPSEAEILAVLPQFTGPIMQLPPIYSALKVAGKRAYDLARAGEEVVLEKRPVTIHTLEFLGMKRVENEVPNLTAPSPTPLSQGERASPLVGLSNSFNDGIADSSDSKRCREGALSPCERGVGEGAVPRPHISEPQKEQIQQYAHDLRSNATDVEEKLWNMLRGRRLEGFKFRRQHPIDRFIVDFVCLEQQLVIELDGGQHGEAKDAQRTAYLESQGFRVLRFWNHDVLANMEGVVLTIQDQLRRPLTQPSPARGEGFAVAPFGGNASTNQGVVGHFRAVVSKGTYIRSLGRDIALAVGSEGYISRLHRAAVGPFTDSDAISLDFIEKSVHNAPPDEGNLSFITPLVRALDDIPELRIDGGQLTQLRHGQRLTLTEPLPDCPQIAVLHEGALVALARVERNQVIPVRVLVF